MVQNDEKSRVILQSNVKRIFIDSDYLILPCQDTS
jgi:hypothetical protein